MSVGTMIHSRIAHYRCVDFLGAGGMGEVYRAVDTRSGRVVALKILTSARDSSFIARFRNEARIHSTLRHPGIAMMYEFLELPGLPPCIAMEYVDGETLETRIRRRGAPQFETAVGYATSLVDAVRTMHADGILHRDIKANNIRINEQGILKLLDFGIAKGPGSPALTADGSVIGTLQSLAPEQLVGVPADTRSDIWSIGVVIYEMMTGIHPFASDDAGSITGRIMAGKYIQPTRVKNSLPTGIDTIIGRCLRVEPRQRYASCDALLADLRELAQPSAHDATPATPWLAMVPPAVSGIRRTVSRHLKPLLATAGVLAVAFIGWQLSRPDEPAVGPQPPAPVTTDGRTGRANPELRAVTIHAVNGTAEVWQDGALVGRTPYRLQAPLGTAISLTLKRPGYVDEKVQFDITEGRTEYSFVMQPIRAATDIHPVAAFGWLLLPWFRRRRTSDDTGIRPVLSSRDPSLPVESRIVVGTATDPGCVRTDNEDTVRVVRSTGVDLSRDGMMATVCDGMGGHAAGEVASRIAADAIAREYARGSDPGEALVRAIRIANREVFSAAGDDPRLRGMGTTCTAMVLKGGLAWCSHVGDSRCYLIRDGQILLMTEDHSAVMAMVRDGTLTREEARLHPDKNVISRALGSHRDVEVSSWARPFVIRPGDRFLLCSDGLHDLADDDDILAAIGDVPPNESCARLVAMARGRGAPDNVSVIVLAVPDNGAENAPGTTRQIPIPAVA